MPAFYELFAGGGMVRAGLGAAWRCDVANDFDPRKAAIYRDNWADDDAFHEGDVGALSTADLPGRADLMWGSFPCQDLSVAGLGAGLDGARSGAFFPFWRLVQELAREGRAPRIVAIENVCGALTSCGGAGFRTICEAFAATGYRFGAMVIDAALFVPQSRPRLFVVGVAPDVAVPSPLIAGEPDPAIHPLAMAKALAALPSATLAQSVWWRMPPPTKRTLTLSHLLETDLPKRAWHGADKTQRLLSLMAPIHRAKVQALQGAGVNAVGAVYRRTRRTSDGARIQRAEVRFDGLAGCLRTPAGGSSLQTLMMVENGVVRSRLITPRETARLMGLPDTYRLPPRASDAYHLTGDGVVVDVVRHLGATLFEPLLADSAPRAAQRAERTPIAAVRA